MATKIEPLLLARAAEMAGIKLSELGSNEHPWNSQHRSAVFWRDAVKKLNPAVGQAMEEEHGAPISLGLALALDGKAPLTQELTLEWQSKRPAAYQAHRQSLIDAATADLAKRTEQLAQHNSREALAQRRAQAVAAQHQSLVTANARLRADAIARGVW
jgi:hypothetical protein